MRSATIDDFTAARNQLPLVIEKVVIRIFQLGVILVVRFDPIAEAFAFDIVARAPSGEKYHLSAELGAGLDDTGVGSAGGDVERDAGPERNLGLQRRQDVRDDIDSRPPVRL